MNLEKKMKLKILSKDFLLILTHLNGTCQLIKGKFEVYPVSISTIKHLKKGCIINRIHIVY